MFNVDHLSNCLIHEFNLFDGPYISYAYKDTNCLVRISICSINARRVYLLSNTLTGLHAYSIVVNT